MALAILIFLPLPSFAFDTIKCEGILRDWSVWNGSGKNDKILDNQKSAVSLPEKKSQMLIVKNGKGASVLEIYPWDGIDLTVKDKSQKHVLQTDKISWFEITFPGATERKLLCRLSF